MQKYAFIDSQNLKKSVEAIDKKIDYKRFRLWLERKYDISCAIMYFGFMESQQDHYAYLRKCGFDLVFRDVDKRLGKIKSNVDICLTIWVMDHLGEIEKAHLVTSDGDFYDLVERLKQDDKFGGVISPSSTNNCSSLLEKSAKGKIDYIPDLIHKFEDRS
ncbi:MAG: NYN domain-containing protein [Lentilitoribacter sp.]